jgi:arylsulfatase
MEKLDEWDAWENTLVIFTTDNGQAGKGAKKDGEKVFLHTAGFKSGKGSVHEGGSHVPSFWRWKGVLDEGADIKALTAHIDIYETFCDLAGAEIPDGIQQIDGRTMLPLLEDTEADWADRHLFFHQGRWEKEEDPNLSQHKNYAVRNTRWRLVNHVELYEISNDPYESTNVADQYPEVVAELRKVYDQWWKETVPLMVNEDAPFAEKHPQGARYEKQLAEKGIPDWETPEL